MSNEVDYKNNPLHGVGLNQVLTELVEHYGFEILYAYLNINCFKTNPSIKSSEKFLKKTEWAREKVEIFYLYKYKNLPRVSSEQFALSPRDRVVPTNQKPGEPAELSLEDAEIQREKSAKKAAEFGKSKRSPHSRPKPSRSRNHDSDSPYKKRDSSDSRGSSDANGATDDDPWAKWR
ncbi:VF530 family protein [Aliamphritea ceti]|uniref:VF530 family protein n=1 Tax=Aliamphritea ceti TaxID=1524258 RepID=UPI0021C28F9B|nr:VF530 family protein [Aliamphritea ceti]